MHEPEHTCGHMTMLGMAEGMAIQLYISGTSLALTYTVLHCRLGN